MNLNAEQAAGAVSRAHETLIRNTTDDEWARMVVEMYPQLRRLIDLVDRLETVTTERDLAREKCDKLNSLLDDQEIELDHLKTRADNFIALLERADGLDEETREAMEELRCRV